MAGEDTVLEEAMDNLKEAGQRIRATQSLTAYCSCIETKDPLPACKRIHEGLAQKVVEAVERGMKSRKAVHPIWCRVLRQTLH